MVVHGAPHLPVDLQSLQIELSLYSLCVEHLRKDCQFVLAKIEGFCGCRDSRKKHILQSFFPGTRLICGTAGDCERGTSTVFSTSECGGLKMRHVLRLMCVSAVT